MIHITEPCHENWEGMKPNDQGRFCSKCSKTVHDFTDNTQNEILEVYQINKGGICGRIKNPVNRDASFDTPIKWLRKFCLALILTFGTTLFVFGDTRMEGYLKVFGTDSIVKNDSLSFPVLKGQVIDEETGEPLPFASVYTQFDEQVFGALTDFDGNFSFEIKCNVKNYSLRVNFSSIGYSKQALFVSIKNENLDYDLGKVKMKTSAKISTGIIVVGTIRLTDEEPNKTTIRGKRLRRLLR